MALPSNRNVQSVTNCNILWIMYNVITMQLYKFFIATKNISFFGLTEKIVHVFVSRENILYIC